MNEFERLTPLSIELNLEDGAWSDIVDPLNGQIERLGILPNATQRGKPVVMLLIRLDDGRRVVAQTTYNLFISASRAAQARYGEPT